MSGRLLPLGFLRQGNPFPEYLHVRKTDVASGSDAAPAKSALYVCGLPLAFSDADVRQLFSCFGDVQATAIHPTKRSGIVVFASIEGVENVSQAVKQGQVAELPGPATDNDQADEPCGLKAWVVAHKALRPGNAELQAQLDAWTESHETQEAARLKAQQEAMGEDGWTVVVRSKGRKRTREQDGIVKQSGGVAKRAAEARAATKQTVQLEDFYRFQRREKRRNELLDLRSKFEADRKRLQTMRATRNFKPV